MEKISFDKNKTFVKDNDKYLQNLDLGLDGKGYEVVCCCFKLQPLQIL